MKYVAFHNLLPEVEKKRVRTEYLLRLCVVWMLMLAIVSLVGTVALIPAYFKITSEVEMLRLALTTYEHEQSMQVDDYSEQERQVRDMISTMDFFEAHDMGYVVTNVVTNVLNARSDLIAVSGVNLDSTKAVLLVEGVAGTRDALVAFAHSLEQVDGFGKVPIPLAHLAEQTDIYFRLTIPLST